VKADQPVLPALHVVLLVTTAAAADDAAEAFLEGRDEERADARR